MNKATAKWPLQFLTLTFSRHFPFLHSHSVAFTFAVQSPSSLFLPHNWLSQLISLVWRCLCAFVDHKHVFRFYYLSHWFCFSTLMFVCVFVRVCACACICRIFIVCARYGLIKISKANNMTWKQSMPGNIIPYCLPKIWGWGKCEGQK